MRLIDADALKFKNVAEVNGILMHILTAEEIDNAPTVELTNNQAYDKGFITAMKLYARPQENLISQLTELYSEYCKNCLVTDDNECTDCIITHIRGIIGGKEE